MVPADFTTGDDGSLLVSPSSPPVSSSPAAARYSSGIVRLGRRLPGDRFRLPGDSGGVEAAEKERSWLCWGDLRCLGVDGFLEDTLAGEGGLVLLPVVRVPGDWLLLLRAAPGGSCGALVSSGCELNGRDKLLQDLRTYSLGCLSPVVPWVVLLRGAESRPPYPVLIGRSALRAALIGRSVLLRDWGSLEDRELIWW